MDAVVLSIVRKEWFETVKQTLENKIKEKK